MQAPIRQVLLTALDQPLALMYPSGMVIVNRILYVADTYNDAIRVIYLNSGQVETLID